MMWLQPPASHLTHCDSTSPSTINAKRHGHIKRVDYTHSMIDNSITKWSRGRNFPKLHAPPMMMTIMFGFSSTARIVVIGDGDDDDDDGE